MIPPARRRVKSRFGSARLTQRSGPAQDGEALDDAEGRHRTRGTKAEIILLSIACNALLHSRMKSRARRCERAVHCGEKSWPCVISPVYTRADSSGFTGKPPVRNKLGRAIGPAPFSFHRLPHTFRHPGESRGPWRNRSLGGAIRPGTRLDPGFRRDDGFREDRHHGRHHPPSPLAIPHSPLTPPPHSPLATPTPITSPSPSPCPELTFPPEKPMCHTIPAPRAMATPPRAPFVITSPDRFFTNTCLLQSSD